MKLSTHLFRILTLLATFSSIPLCISAEPQATETVSFILLPNQSLSIPLLTYASSQNITFTLSDPPKNSQLNNPLASNSSYPLNNPPENITAVKINATFIAMVDQNYTLYYSLIEENLSGLNLSSVSLQATSGSECTSIVFSNEYVAVSCVFLNTSTNDEIHTLYLFDTNSNNVTTMFQTIANGTKTLVPVTIVDSSNLRMPAIAVSFENPNATQTFCLYLPLNSGTICNSAQNPSTNFSLQSMQANPLQTYFFDASGNVFFADFLGDQQVIDPLNFLFSLQDTIIGSCANPLDYRNFPSVGFSNTTFYYLSNYTVVYTFSVPEGFSTVSCALDAKFLYAAGKHTKDGSYQIFMYALDNINDQNFLLGFPIVSETVIALSTGQTVGQVNVLTSSSIKMIAASLPSIQLQDVQESNTFSVTVDNNNQTIAFNITVISQPEQIYQIGNSIASISSISTPTVNLQSVFVGPSLGVTTGTKNFFGGVYGTCTLSNFNTLNLTSYDSLVVKINPTQTVSPTSNGISGTIVYTAGSSIGYIDILFSNPYSAGNWTSPQTCSPTVQVTQSPTVYNFSAAPTQCLFGQDYDLCQVNNQIYHVTQSQNTPLVTDYGCEGAYLWEGSSQGTQVTVCITSNNITVLYPDGTPLASIASNEVGIDAFSSELVSTNPLFPELLVVSYSKGIIGLQVPLTPQDPIMYMPVTVIFNFERNFSNNSYLQVTPNRLVLADFGDNTIVEWDISDLYNPFFVGNYELFSFTLDSSLTPFYNPTPNHLIFLATNNKVPYLLTFQPGNIATSVLLYATSLQGISGISAGSQGTQNLTITSTYDPINELTLYFVSNQASMNYFYAPASSMIALPNVTLGQANCLYCPGNAQIQVSSNVITVTPIAVSVSYTAISTEQSISIQNPPQLSIKSDAPVIEAPTSLFQGTTLDYSISSIMVDQTQAIYMKTPLNLSQTITTSESSTNDFPYGLINQFSDGTNLYFISGKGLQYINLQSTPPYKVISSSLTLPYQNSTLISGDAKPQGVVAVAFNQGYQWGVVLYPSNVYVLISNPILKLRVVGQMIFVLTQGNLNLLYVLNGGYQQLSLISTIKLGMPGLVPIDFTADSLFQDIYAILLIDGTDTLYSAIVNITSGSTQYTQIFSDITQMVNQDLPPEPLEIIALQSDNTGFGEQTTGINYLLSVQNFHTYQFQFAYTGVNQIQIHSIINCFIQMPEHISLGNHFMTDFYFLDIKQKGSQYYVYNYPLNATYNASFGQNGSYPYVKPIQRQAISGTSNMSIYGISGVLGQAFVVIGQLAQDNSMQSFDVLVYNVTNFFEIGFNPSLSSTSLSTLGLDQANLTLFNDINAANLMISFDTPINILNSAYFIAFTCVFTIVFCAACIWFFRRAYKKRQLKLAQEKGSYHAAEEEGIVVEK